GGEAVTRVEGVEPPHDPIARHLRHDRGGGDGCALRVAVDDVAVRRGQRTEPKAVDEALVRAWREIVEHVPQAGEVRAVEAVAIDVTGGNDAYRYLRRGAQHGPQQHL